MRAAFLAILRVMWRSAVRPRADVYAEGLQVIGFWARYWTPGAAIRRIEPEDGMRVTTTGGDVIVPRLTGAEVAPAVTGFHPLWRTVPAPDLTWIDRSCAHGTFRMWAALTAHLQNALLTTADASVDRALLGRLFRRVAPPL